MEQVMIKNAAAEDRIDELERQLQSLKQKEGASQSNSKIVVGLRLHGKMTKMFK